MSSADNNQIEVPEPYTAVGGCWSMRDGKVKPDCLLYEVPDIAGVFLAVRDSPTVEWAVVSWFVNKYKALEYKSRELPYRWVAVAGQYPIVEDLKTEKGK